MSHEITNPCSGHYSGDVGGTDVEIMVDIDETREFSKALKFVSGTIKPRVRPWNVDAASVHFRVLPVALQISGGESNTRRVNSGIKAVYSDGTIAGGSLELHLAFDKKKGKWRADMDLNINGVGKLSYEGVKRKSLFFREVFLSMDYTDKPQWPTVELRHLVDAPPAMSERKIDPSIVFEDAGIELLNDPKKSRKVDDPTPGTPWTKSDLYEVMEEFFSRPGNSDENIWCMIGTTPPDKRHVGFFLNRKGHRGFGLFTGHSSFNGLEDTDEHKKAIAQRRFLHYLVNECGHCLGLKHSFNNGTPDSLSWMNYTWKYDDKYGVGSFYRDFRFSFSDKELLVLRHSPGKAFQETSNPSVVLSITSSGYEAKTEAPDHQLADDDDDDDLESYDPSGTVTTEKPRPTRKIALDLKLKKKYSTSQLLNFEARIKNKGKLPALIEGDLSAESGNLQLYISKDGGRYKTVNPLVRPIHSAYGKPKVLYPPEDEEGPDRYSQQVTVGVGPDGLIVDGPGDYEIRAVYHGGRYTASSDSYKVTIVDDAKEDAATREEVLTAATLQSSSYERFRQAFDHWKKLKSKEAEEKKYHAHTTLALLQGIAKANDRYESLSSKAPTGRGKKTDVPYGKPALDRQQLLDDTDELVSHYHEQGTKEDNFDYSSLVLARGKLYVALNKVEDGAKEFDRLIADVRNRGVKKGAIMRLTKKWNKITNPSTEEERYKAENLQKKVESVLKYAPPSSGDGESEITGLGLGRPFSNFDIDHIEKAFVVIDKLFKKYEETQDLHATIQYADKLQKGREVNEEVLQWALKAFTVHSRDAKKAGIRYPEPEHKDGKMDTVLGAELKPAFRRGIPDEHWMDYWRCDADMNYHHEHWHMVYILGFELRKRERNKWIRIDPYLWREGEYFGYMHSQMLARIQAERESWGMQPVARWEYSEKSHPFNAGPEFAEDPRLANFVPRPAATWPRSTQQKFLKWESAYKTAVEKGKFIAADGKEEVLTTNWAGLLLEPVSNTFNHMYGAIHNTGHLTFASVGIDSFPKFRSYMGRTKVAARDFIFYRWHRRIDDLYQMINNKTYIDIIEDAPPVIITADDIILSSDPNPPKDFGSFKGDWVSKAPAGVASLNTMLGPPIKRYELDNKLDHEKFYYHLRIKRNAKSKKKHALRLTIRIFICPKKRQSDRKRWIEMDKFVCEIEANKEYTTFTRRDVESSVIKRNPKDMVDSIENKYTKEVAGFCDCGWPYSMLLPRGKKDGEEYVLLVMATDNTKDSIDVRTKCGSMSYCGADDPSYPDKRTMGYPFAHPIKIHGENQELQIPEAFDRISNAAYKTFFIKNDVAEPPPIKAVDIWWPQYQVNQVRADNPDQDVSPIFQYQPSKLTGQFRVLIDDQSSVAPKGKQIMIRFMGRGRNNGSYKIRDVTIYPSGNKAAARKVTSEGKENFIVPEFGLISDPLIFDFDPVKSDHYISFTTDTPGAYLDAPQGSTQTSTYHEVGGTSHRYPYIQCIGGIMSSLPE